MSILAFEGSEANVVDIGRAFSFVFEDQDWVAKFLIGCLFTALGLAVFLLFYLIGFFLNFVSFLTAVPLGNLVTLFGAIGMIFTIGYIVDLTRNVAGGDPRPLPNWNTLVRLTRRGFILFLASVIYNLPIVLLTLCASVAALALSSSTSSDPSGFTASNGIQLVSACVSGLYGLALFVIFPAVVIRYAVTDRFVACFQFGQLFHFISANLGNYVVALLVTILAAVVGMLGLIVCGVGVIATGFYAELVAGHIFGQTYREAVARGTAPPIT